jgi:hypothetical protein
VSDKPLHAIEGEEDELYLGKVAFHSCAQALGPDKEKVEYKITGFMQRMSKAFEHALGENSTSNTALALYAMAVEELTYRAARHQGWDKEKYVQGVQFSAETFGQVMQLLGGMRLDQWEKAENKIITH